MNAARFRAIAARIPRLRIAIVGDFCLDRYLEIDPARAEISIETGRPVHNVVNVRSQPGGAGTILNNLVALGVGRIYAVGFAGEDGEGYELKRALESKSRTDTSHFIQTPLRRTFTYTKPLVVAPGKTPLELDRLDIKNWTPTPAVMQSKIISAVRSLAQRVDAIILLDQVDVPETGVVTRKLLTAVRGLCQGLPRLLILADSRRGLRGYPPVCFKMNRAELAALTSNLRGSNLPALKLAAGKLARRQGRNCFVTLAECGILGASPDGAVDHVPALPARGEIDVVGAGDAVTANLTAALAAGAGLREALEIANAAASIVIHQLGTTGTASLKQIQLLANGRLP
jgi:rfaE bifunctional protein kinase chain/domain